MKIILLNGPPSSGKDTALRAIWQHLDVYDEVYGHTLRMSAPIKEAFTAMMGHKLDKFGDIIGMTQEHKEQINPTLGCSSRQWQIDFSERFMKPLYGQNVFARIWLHRAAQLASETVVIVPDCGFKIEVRALIDAANSPDYPYLNIPDLFLIRLYRRGFTFDLDSREYTHMENYNSDKGFIREADIINEDKDIFEATIIKQVTSFLKGEA